MSDRSNMTHLSPSRKVAVLRDVTNTNVISLNDCVDSLKRSFSLSSPPPSSPRTWGAGSDTESESEWDAIENLAFSTEDAFFSSLGSRSSSASASRLLKNISRKQARAVQRKAAAAAAKATKKAARRDASETLSISRQALRATKEALSAGSLPSILPRPDTAPPAPAGLTKVAGSKPLAPNVDAFISWESCALASPALPSSDPIPFTANPFALLAELESPSMPAAAPAPEKKKAHNWFWSGVRFLGRVVATVAAAAKTAFSVLKRLL